MRKYRARARFVKNASRPLPQNSPMVSAHQADSYRSHQTMADLDDFPAHVPAHFLRPPPLLDDLVTSTSEVQEKTLEECLPLLRAAGDPTRSPFDFNEFGLPELRRGSHIDFLHENLSEFPAPFVGLDASRPWLAYWGLMGLYFLGEDVTPMRQRSVLVSCLVHFDAR